MILRYSLVFIMLALTITSSYSQSTSQCSSILDEMLLSADNVKSLRYKLKQYEMVEDELIYGEQDVKLQLQPLMIYMFIHAPNQGAEVLWKEGENNGDALVNPNAFPYVNLNLDPYGLILRRNQHHTIFSSGFGFLASIIRAGIKKAGADFDKYFRYEGDITWEGRECYQIVIEYDHYTWMPYEVKAGEDLISIAKDNKICDYILIERNDGVDDFDDVKVGQVIQIPNVYAKKNILYIDKKLKLPIRMEMYDDKGFFERYEISQIEVNPVIPPEEFSENYKDYGY